MNATSPKPEDLVALVAEDHDSLRDLISASLRLEGFRVIAAADGEAALEAAGSSPIDLLVSDLQMPRMGGRELAARLLAAQPGVAVLLTSGQESPPATRHRFLAKPFSSVDLLHACLEVLEARAG